MGRRPCCDKVGLKKGRWTAEEDHRLKNYILANGEGSWRSLPKNAGLLRCGKSCRLRWINYLRSDLKRGNFTTEEEDTIIKLNASLGNRWSLIASHLPGRTDNEIKNYWNSHLSRQIHTFRRRSGGDDGSVIVDVARLRLPPRRKDRRVRRIKEAETAADTGDRESPDEEIINEPTEGRREVGRFLSPSLNRDDMSLNLDELLNNVEMELDDNDDVIKMHEAVTCKSNTTTAAAPAAVSDAGSAEMDTGGECSSICSSPFRLQSPWNWESFVGGQEWDAAEFIAAEDLAESDAVISWLLS